MYIVHVLHNGCKLSKCFQAVAGNGLKRKSIPEHVVAKIVVLDQEEVH